MQLPIWMDTGKVAIIAALTLMLVQYAKVLVPEGYVKLFAILIAVLVAILMQFAEINIYAKICLYALFAVATADTGYKFLSSGKSQLFSLPTKAQEEAGEKKV